MKVKEITLAEDTYEVTTKPMPGATSIEVGGQSVGTAKDPQTAQTVAQAAKDGKLSLTPPGTQGGNSGAQVQEEPGNDPQMASLQKLLTTAQQPWEQAQIKWRMENLKSQQSLAGEPGAGMGAPVDARGNLIPVLPPKEWMAKNPSIVKQLPNEALPPEMQQPGMLNKIKGAMGLNESVELNRIKSLSGL
jgi:hypothetical protein